VQSTRTSESVSEMPLSYSYGHVVNSTANKEVAPSPTTSKAAAPQDSKNTQNVVDLTTNNNELGEYEYDPVNPSEFDMEDPASEFAMMKMMGIPFGFDSTKGKHVEGNDWYATKVKSQRVYRQYMNRRGGFNKKLDPDKNVSRNTKEKKKKDKERKEKHGGKAGDVKTKKGRSKGGKKAA